MLQVEENAKLLSQLKEKLQELKKNVQELQDEQIKIAIIIGPEGGIDTKEVDMLEQSGANPITLGKRILRTETVALNVLSIIMYEFGE